MNLKMIIHTLGRVICFEAVCMLLSLICSIFVKDGMIPVFLVSIGICLAVGIPMSRVKPLEKKFYSRNGFITVALSWIFLSIHGAVPFVISGYIPKFVDALFETASGFTTTGASILTDVEVLPRSLLFWRSFTHWVGGMGVIVFVVAVLPLSGGSNMHLLRAESPGPSVGKLVPKVRQTAKILYMIYFFITLIQVVLLLFGGMSLYEALTLSFGTVGTGGFAILNSGIATYSSYVQIVITVFMILCGINFSIYYLVLMGKWKVAARSSELWCYLGIIFVSVVAIAFNCRELFPDIGDAFKHSAFQVGSIITTTGYSTCDFDLWPSFSKTILVILMFIGASAGSTGGGIKVSRIIILIKSIIKEIKITAHPKRTCKLTMDGRGIEHETVRGVNVFVAAYLVIYAVSLIVISLDNMDFTTNFTAVAATINNIGPGLAGVGPTSNFSHFSDLSTLVLTFDMLAGRLEIFPLLVLFSPMAWKK